ncbi:Kelch repeat-containing protein [Amycolatopsis jejuensis]|uniref:Kelch repeat-containing protein n=1 Tax=Amycolatopsis jejuensis TaxID=330084 RepID=UPI00052775A6|nr:kelch repeat-containing protein [Amycolatopsis jejuensis]
MRRVTTLALGLTLLVAPVVPASADSVQHPPGWQTLAPIAGGPRQEHAVAEAGGRVYVAGGVHFTADGRLTTTNRVEVYDPRRNSWSEVAPLPVALNHPNLAAVGGRLYVLGGLAGGDSWRAVPDSYVYEPWTGRWTPLPPMPSGTERGSAAMGVRGTRIYLAGGMRTLTPRDGGLQDTVDTVSSYDVVTGRWETLPSLPQARDHAGGAMIGRTLYVVGGRDRGQANVRGTVYALDLRSLRWTERAPMPTPRGGIATATVAGKIYTFGGEGNPAPGSHSVFAETEAYDAARDTWQRLEPMPVPRHGTAATAVDGTIYLPGGGTEGGGNPVDVNDAYHPAR